jgi:magnesium-transporting ATPase (P-type)
MVQVSDLDDCEKMDRADRLLNRIGQSFGRQTVDDMADAIIALTDVRLEACPIEAVYKPQGAPCEAGLIRFIMENDYQSAGGDVARLMKYRNSDETRKIACLPFDQALKRKIVIRKVPSDPNAARIYLQGAPEEVIGLCKFKYNVKNNRSPLPQSRQDKHSLLDQTVSGRMAEQGLKVFSIAYKDTTIDELQKIISTHNEESPEFRDTIERDLVYLCTFGFDDPLRADIPEAVQEIQGRSEVAASPSKGESEKKRGVIIRMVSGDHLETARYVADQAGILGANPSADAIMSGAEFREKIGAHKVVVARETQEKSVHFTNIDQFNKVKKRLRVLARASAEDKLVLIAGIKST